MLEEGEERSDARAVSRTIQKIPPLKFRSKFQLLRTDGCLLKVDGESEND